jgi:hypothetical protein
LKIPVTLFLIALDTLLGSVGIHDNGHLFKYSRLARDNAANDIIKMLHTLEVSVEIEGEK